MNTLKKRLPSIYLWAFFTLLILPFSSQAGFTRPADGFQSNGDPIAGWYWLRDPSLQQYAEWTFRNIPPGHTLRLEITALATDRMNGAEGFDARFLILYGFPGSGNRGGVLQAEVVSLPNTSPPDDPVGYTCRGTITIDRSFMAGADDIFIRVERESSEDNHVAFQKHSIRLDTV